MTGLVVWGVGTPRTLRVHWALHELGLAYETTPIQSRTGETQTEVFTGLNARQKIPVLQDGALSFTESAAIVVYLSDRYGTSETALLPADPVARAQCMEWCFFALTELDATSLYVLRRHEGLPAIYGEAPAANAAARAYFTKQLRSLTRALEDGRKFLVDARFSAADIMMCSCLTWARGVEITLPASARDYETRLRVRAAYRAANARNSVPAA